MRRPRVIIESPFAGDRARNVRYAEALMFNSLSLGEAPILGHLLYPRVLDEDIPEDREAGLEAHISHIAGSEFMVVGMDLGAPTPGMQRAIDLADGLKLRIVPRWLGPGWPEFPIRPTKGFR